MTPSFLYCCLALWQESIFHSSPIRPRISGVRIAVSLHRFDRMLCAASIQSFVDCSYLRATDTLRWYRPGHTRPAGGSQWRTVPACNGYPVTSLIFMVNNSVFQREYCLPESPGKWFIRSCNKEQRCSKGPRRERPAGEDFRPSIPDSMYQLTRNSCDEGAMNTHLSCVQRDGTLFCYRNVWFCMSLLSGSVHALASSQDVEERGRLSVTVQNYARDVE